MNEPVEVRFMVLRRDDSLEGHTIYATVNEARADYHTPYTIIEQLEAMRYKVTPVAVIRKAELDKAEQRIERLEKVAAAAREQAQAESNWGTPRLDLDAEERRVWFVACGKTEAAIREYDALRAGGELGQLKPKEPENVIFRDSGCGGVLSAVVLALVSLVVWALVLRGSG